MARRVTQKQLSDLLGVSQMTVSYAFSQPQRVAEPTRRRVLQAADRLGYRPNAAARAQRLGRFKAVAYVVRDGMAAEIRDLQNAIHDALAARGHHLVYACIGQEQIERQATEPRFLSELCVDGLLVQMDLDVPKERVAFARRCGAPVVWLNTVSETGCVYPDEIGGSRHAVQQLIAAGHRRISFVQFGVAWPGGNTHFCVTGRRGGYEQAMEAAGGTPHVLDVHYPATANGRSPWGTPPDDRVQRLRQLLSGPNRPTAVLAANASSAMCIVHAAATLGLRIPEDLSLVGIHHDELPILTTPLATVRVPRAAMGHAAVEMLMPRLADHARRSAPSVVLPMRWEPGASIAAPPANLT